jgi:hypothetical protein
MCSFVSAYGPSVMSTLPANRSDLALLSGCRPPTKNPDTGSLHLVVERVYFAAHRFVL